jgi:hypothetical protein
MIGIKLPETTNDFVAKFGNISDIPAFCVSYLAVSGTCPLDQDLFKGSLKFPLMRI